MANINVKFLVAVVIVAATFVFGPVTSTSHASLVGFSIISQQQSGQAETRLYSIDLMTGVTNDLGIIGFDDAEGSVSRRPGPDRGGGQRRMKIGHPRVSTEQQNPHL